ncbi:VOC family protein [Streptomyces populi]
MPTRLLEAVGYVFLYRAPERPEQNVPQHFHLDFGAPNPDEAEEKALALGATKAAVQLSGGRLRRGFVR